MTEHKRHTPVIDPIGPEFVDTRHAANMIGYTPKALEMMRAKGKGPPYYRPDGRNVRYKIEDLRAWLTSGEVRHDTTR